MSCSPLLVSSASYSRPSYTPGARNNIRRSAAAVILAFLAVAAAASWRISQGLTISDESAYRFQARTFASGSLFSPAPPGAGDRPVDAARPVKWAQEISWRAGWYTKYPIGWPAVLALPERAGLGWLVNPVLGTLLLLITGLFARLAFGTATVIPAVAIAALSPYVLAYSVGRMSHALAAVLIAFATLACLHGIKTRTSSSFVWMCVSLVCSFHVRPFTALVAACVLCLSALCAVRRDRPLFLRALGFTALAATAAIGSVAAFNWVYTGHPGLSPHAFAMGTGFPPETTLAPAIIAHNVWSTWRLAAQSTWIFAFPFLFPLAAYGFWRERSGPAARICVALFIALVTAHLLLREGSGSVVGERFWFEAFFGVVVLGARGVMRLHESWRPARRVAVASICAVTAAQLFMSAAAVEKLDEVSAPRREVRAVAETYQHCHCVVFLSDHPPFYAEHLNLNGPDWRSADVFYAIDPGRSERTAWAQRFGRERWVVVTFDPERKIAVTTSAHTIT